MKKIIVNVDFKIDAIDVDQAYETVHGIMAAAEYTEQHARVESWEVQCFTEVSPLKRAQDHWREGLKITAIKTLREGTNLSVADCKAILESCR